MKIKYFTTCFILLFYSCTALNQSIVKQGLTGNIYLLSGNQMPAIGRPQSKGKGVSRDIYIYQPTTLSQTKGDSPLYSHITTKLVAQTKSDSSGHYAMTLPVGRYSVFVVEADKFFASISDGEGILNPVTVANGTITSLNITLNKNATY